MSVCTNVEGQPANQQSGSAIYSPGRKDNDENQTAGVFFLGVTFKLKC